MYRRFAVKQTYVHQLHRPHGIYQLHGHVLEKLQCRRGMMWCCATHCRTKSLVVTSIPNSSTSVVSTSPKSAKQANMTALAPFWRGTTGTRTQMLLHRVDPIFAYAHKVFVYTCIHISLMCRCKSTCAYV